MTQAPTDTTLVDGPTDEQVDAAVATLGEMEAHPETVTTIESVGDLRALFPGNVAVRTAADLMSVAGAPRGLDGSAGEIVVIAPVFIMERPVLEAPVLEAEALAFEDAAAAFSNSPDAELQDALEAALAGLYPAMQEGRIDAGYLAQAEGRVEALLEVAPEFAALKDSGLLAEAEEEVAHTINYDAIIEFEAAVKLFDDTTMRTIVAEEILGIGGHADANAVFDYADAIGDYMDDVAAGGPVDIAQAEAELDQIVDVSPLANFRAVDVKLATVRLEILTHALENLHAAHQKGRVSDSYYAAAEAEAKKLLELYGHETDLEATGAHVVVVDFSAKPEPVM